MENVLTVSVPEAAKRLGVSSALVWKLIRSGEIPAVKLGGRTVVSVEVLNKIANGK